MSDARDPSHTALKPASLHEVAQALSYALCHDARGKPRRGGEDIMSAIVAEQLVEHLARSGFVVMRAGPARAHSTG